MKSLIMSALLLPLILTSAAAGGPKPAPGPNPAPAVTFDTGKETLSLQSMRGSLVLVDFWASWCEPCRKSFPWLNAIARRYAEQGFRIVAVNLDKDRDAAGTFLRDHPPGFTVAYDPSGRAAEAFHVVAMPSSYLIGRDGQILDAHAGFDARATAAIEARLAQEYGR